MTFGLRVGCVQFRLWHIPEALLVEMDSGLWLNSEHAPILTHSGSVP